MPSPHAGRTAPFTAPASIFWVAFAVRVLAILIGHTYRIRLIDDHFDFGFEAGRIARSLATGHGYASPFNGQSGPTAWLPPLYPLLLALCFRLFGVYTRTSALAIMVLDSAFSALIAPAVFEIAARCVDAHGFARRLSPKPAPVALWSTWLWALHPGAMQYAVHWVWEMSLSTCLFTWALVVALRLRGIGDPDPPPTARWPLWLLLGLLWGAIALSNASLLFMFPASLAWILWPVLRRPALLRPHLAGPALSCLIFALVLAPWVVRNEQALHAFVPTRANFGVEFWRSTLFDQSGPLPWGTAMPLSSQEPDFQRYIQLGEVRYAHLKSQQAMRNLRARPGLFLKYTLERIQFFWFCTPHSPEHHPIREYLRVLQYAFTSLAGLLGLALMLHRRVPGSALFALSFVLIPLVYYAITVQPRFRHPLEPLITIAAVFLFRSTGSFDRVKSKTVA